MRRTPLLFLALPLLALAATLPPVHGDDPAPVVKIGTRIDNFTLKDTDGKVWSLKDAKDEKAVVVIFLGTECPINNAYLPKLADLAESYKEQGVRFVAVNSN